MAGTNAICKKINASSQGNNQTVLWAHCSLTETWSANNEKCSWAMLLILLPSYYSQAFQTIRNASHSFQSYQSCTHFYCLLWCLRYEDWSDYSVLDSEVSILCVHLVYQYEKHTGRTREQLFSASCLFGFFLFYKDTGSNYSPPLFKDALKHLFLSANQNFFKAWCLCVSSRASFYTHFKCNTELGFFLV